LVTFASKPDPVIMRWLLLAVSMTVVSCDGQPAPDTVEKMQNDEQPKGVIGRAFEGDRPVIYKFVNEPPSDEKRQALPWLTIISWRYDGSTNNGMPQQELNQRMISLENAIEEGVVTERFCEHAISRTGNNLKELIYYINDRDSFTERLNLALRNHERYPIEITFYEDPEWQEFGRTRADFNAAGEQADEREPE
jgi:hypothetical protein